MDEGNRGRGSLRGDIGPGWTFGAGEGRSGVGEGRGRVARRGGGKEKRRGIGSGYNFAAGEG